MVHVAIGLLTVVCLSLPVVIQTPAAQAAPQGSSHWSWCDAESVKVAPRLLWIKMKEATEQHHDVPGSFWSNVTYRDDIAKITCYEATFEYHAQNASHFGLFQMSSPLIANEGVKFGQYWNGGTVHKVHVGATWFQCLAGERYIHARYGTPVAAWAHEENYGWY